MLLRWRGVVPGTTLFGGPLISPQIHTMHSRLPNQNSRVERSYLYKPQPHHPSIRNSFGVWWAAIIADEADEQRRQRLAQRHGAVVLLFCALVVAPRTRRRSSSFPSSPREQPRSSQQAHTHAVFFSCFFRGGPVAGSAEQCALSGQSVSLAPPPAGSECTRADSDQLHLTGRTNGPERGVAGWDLA